MEGSYFGKNVATTRNHISLLTSTHPLEVIFLKNDKAEWRKYDTVIKGTDINKRTIITKGDFHSKAARGD